MTTKRIRKIPGMDKKRADFAIIGSVLVLALFKYFKKDRIFISDKGIREGLILDYMRKTRMKLKKPKPLLKLQWFGQKPFFSGKMG